VPKPKMASVRFEKVFMEVEGYACAPGEARGKACVYLGLR